VRVARALEQIAAAARARTVPVLGITGTGGSGSAAATVTVAAAPPVQRRLDALLSPPIPAGGEPPADCGC